MRYRTFPGAGIAVSEIGFGTWTLSTGWWGEKTDDEAVAMLKRAHDNFGVDEPPMNYKGTMEKATA